MVEMRNEMSFYISQLTGTSSDQKWQFGVPKQHTGSILCIFVSVLSMRLEHGAVESEEHALEIFRHLRGDKAVGVMFESVDEHLTAGGERHAVQFEEDDGNTQQVEPDEPTQVRHVCMPKPYT